MVEETLPPDPNEDADDEETVEGEDVKADEVPTDDAPTTPEVDDDTDEPEPV